MFKKASCELATGIFILPGNRDIRNKFILETEANAWQFNAKRDGLSVDIKRIYDALCLKSEEITPKR